MDRRELVDQISREGRGSGVADPTLTRADWLMKALDIFIGEGIDAVRITRLAAELGVTRGSFYWHFKDREELLAGLRQFWERKNTAAVLAAVETASVLSEGILNLYAAWLDPERFDPRLDLAMREWARRSREVHKAVHRADDERVEAIAQFFRRNGYADPEAFIRARVIYFTQVGYYALGVKEPRARRFDYLEAYYESHTGRKLDPEVAAAHRARHLRGSGKSK